MTRIGALKSLGVIPRTPSPSRSPTVEAEDAVPPPDLNSMTTEQLIAELSQRRVGYLPHSPGHRGADVLQEREERTVHIKREHAEAFVQDDDDDDEIEWTGTRTVRTRVFGGVVE